MIWAEVAQKSQAWRFETLSQELQECGVVNTLKLVSATSENLLEVVEALKKSEPELTQIRFDDSLAADVPNLSVQAPAWIHTIKCADTLIFDLGQWWPRNFLYDGVLLAMAVDFKDLDLAAGVFIAGASCEMRTLIFALSRVGFDKFNIMDPDEGRAQTLIAELKKSCFGVQFQQTKKNTVIQLPAIYSMGISTLSLVEFPELLDELYYLNFLKPGGVWIETEPSATESPLMIEAAGLGAKIYSPIQLLSQVDFAWAKATCGVEIDLARYQKNIVSRLATLS